MFVDGIDLLVVGFGGSGKDIPDVEMVVFVGFKEALVEVLINLLIDPLDLLFAIHDAIPQHARLDHSKYDKFNFYYRSFRS